MHRLVINLGMVLSFSHSLYFSFLSFLIISYSLGLSLALSLSLSLYIYIYIYIYIYTLFLSVSCFPSPLLSFSPRFFISSTLTCTHIAVLPEFELKELAAMQSNVVDLGSNVLKINMNREREPISAQFLAASGGLKRGQDVIHSKL